jgi:hypothetical protein
MAEQIKAQVTEIATTLTDEMASRFAGVMKAVIPDVTKPLAKAAERFQNELVKGSGRNVEKAYVELQSILKKFDVQLSDLGEDFKKTSDALEAVEKSRSKALEEVEKLREKNIVAEAKFIPNIKNNQKEYKAIILSDKELVEKRQLLLLKEQAAKNKERELLEDLRKFQKGEVKLNKKEREVLTDQILVAQLKAQTVQEEKKLYEGKGGRFDTRIGGFLDDFENAVNEKAPDFLIPVIQPIIEIARQFQKTISLLIDGLTSTAKFVGKFLPESFKKGFADMFGSLKKTVGGLIGTLATFGKRIILTGITMLAAIVAPLLPLLIPLLKFAVVVGLVVGGLMLLKKGFDALTNWFKNSWLGKKIFGGDKEKEPKKGSAGDMAGEAAMFDDDMTYGGRSKKKKPKVVAKEEETISVEKKPAKVVATTDEEKDAFGDTKFEAYMQDKEMDAYMKGEETTSMKKNRVRQETEALRKEKIYSDNESENKIMQLAEEKYGGGREGYKKAKAELYPELVAKEKELEELIKKEKEEELAAKKAFVEKKVKSKSTKKVTTTETVTGGKETVTKLDDDTMKKIDDRNKIYGEYEDKIYDLMDSPEYKKMGKDERVAAVVALENERNKLMGEPPLKEFQIQTIKNGVEFEMKQEKKIMSKDLKKDLTLPADQTGGQPVVINNVTAPQNVASSSTQQVISANAAKSNDDTFLNLNKHV